MTGYNLSKNYTDNPEALLRKNRSHTASSSAIPPTVELVTLVPSATTEMAKSLRDYSTPARSERRAPSPGEISCGASITLPAAAVEALQREREDALGAAEDA